jgi:cytochrome c553
MTRLIVFAISVVGLLSILNLRGYKSEAVSNKKFNFKSAEQGWKDYQAKIHPVKKVKKVASEAPEAKQFAVVLSTDELKNGKKLYSKCIVCHGKLGEGKASQKAPKIGGQHSWYLEEQIVNMKNGSRINKVMMPYVKKLSTQDISDISAYVTKLPWK